MKAKTKKIILEVSYELLLIIGAINIGAFLKYNLSWVIGMFVIIVAVWIKLKFLK